MKSESTVSHLVEKIQTGEIMLPEMQRGYVWRSTNVRDLFDSLYRGYPSGVILAWETDLPVETRPFAVAAASSPVRPMLLLDGQQRLTSLAAILSGKGVTVKDRKTEIRLLFNLDHPDELPFVTSISEGGDDDDIDVHERMRRMAFVVRTNQLAAQPQWVDVSDVFSKSDGEILQAAGVESFTDPRYEKYSERLKAVRRIKDYVYRMDVLDRSMSYEEVTEIFVRVNSLGVRLRSSDLALAQITARWRGSLEIFTAFQERINQLGFELDMGTILRALVVVTTGQSKFRAVSALTRDQLETGWKRTTKALEFAVDYLKSNLNIDSLVLLSSPYFVITTAFWADRLGYTISKNEATLYNRWLLTASAKSHFAGSSETKLDQDLSFIERHTSSNGLLTRLENEVGRLDFTPGEIAGRSTRHGVFKTLFMALREDGAADWSSNLTIAPTHSEKSSKIEYHHIFPKQYLQATRPELPKDTVNQLANMAFIGSRTNKTISARAPHDYRHEFSDDRFAEQFIDFDDGLDQPENFEAFIAARAEKIAERVNRFLAGPDAG